MYILVVADDPAVGKIMEMALTGEGQRAVSVRSASAALNTLQTQPPPDLVLLDFKLPEMDAGEFLRRYRAMPGVHPAPVVICIAWPISDDEALAAGAVARLEQPFGLDELLTTVDCAAGTAL